MLIIRNWAMLPQVLRHASQKLTQYGQTLLPLSCLLCQQGVTAGVICPTCAADLEQSYCHCLRCGLPLPSTQTQCGHCLAHQPNFERLYACGLFRPPLNQVVFQLKYAKQPLFANILGQMLANQVKQQLPASQSLPELLVPVPLHAKKERQRGFNQAQLIAQHCGQQLNIPVNTTAVKRIKNTQSQTQLTRQQRQQNMHRAFKQMTALQGISHLAIVDDIVTTGATANSLSQVLKQAGVKKIDIWCVCRTANRPKSS